MATGARAAMRRGTAIADVPVIDGHGEATYKDA